MLLTLTTILASANTNAFPATDAVMITYGPNTTPSWVCRAYNSNTEEISDYHFFNTGGDFAQGQRITYDTTTAAPTVESIHNAPDGDRIFLTTCRKVSALFQETRSMMDAMSITNGAATLCTTNDHHILSLFRLGENFESTIGYQTSINTLEKTGHVVSAFSLQQDGSIQYNGTGDLGALQQVGNIPTGITFDTDEQHAFASLQRALSNLQADTTIRRCFEWSFQEER